jgi:HEAT repeat protein
MRSKTQGSLRPLLSGGDRRMIAQSSRALKIVRANPDIVAQLAKLAADEDWLVSMRAMDLLEKLAQEHPEWIEPHKHLFIGPLADSEQWEIRLQVVRALPLLSWSPAETKRVLEILLRDAEHPQKFVRAWAADSLASFAEKDSTLLPPLNRCLKKLERSGSKALMSRARQIVARMTAGKRSGKSNSV